MAKQITQKTIEIYKHKGQRRANNPQVGLVTSTTDKPLVKTQKYSHGLKSDQYKYDPHFDPQLDWAGKAERLSFEVPLVPLHIHEKIDPRSIIEIVRKRNTIDTRQLCFFHNPTEQRPIKKEIEFYQHEKLWSNRLIAGDSLLVMNSLLQKEAMAGKVQCIYIDPPYGIEYGSNFQPFIGKRNVQDRKDEDLTAEPEMIKAFRDTWELGIHSYLTYLRDRLLLAKELLTESGSCFVQISDENVHLVRNLMDEIFGKENFVTNITFQKTGSLPSNYMSNTCDYIICYGKNKKMTKWRKLYMDRSSSLHLLKSYNFIENKNKKEITSITQEDKNISYFNKNKDFIFQSVSMESSGSSEMGSREIEINGQTFKPRNNAHWKTTLEGIKKLHKARRLLISKNSIRYKMMFRDFPVTSLTNIWSDLMGATDLKYIVQTNEKVIQRCILMTTDPGDLVLDPTCGSGTTAYVAEKWGRRWITCDTSRVALALAKQRLMTATFDYYQIKEPAQGVSSGFNYKTVPHITLKSIANNPDIKEGMSQKAIEEAIARHAPQEILYDQPLIDKTKLRVSGPFTVEAVPATRVESTTKDKPYGEQIKFEAEWFDNLKQNGIRGKKGLSKDIAFTRLELIHDAQYIHAEGETQDGQKVIVCFTSPYSLLEKRQVEEALTEAKVYRTDLVIFCAFQFDADCSKDIQEINIGKTKILKVQMNNDLFTFDLKQKIKNEKEKSFWLIGEPDVQIEKIKKGEHKGKYIARVEGFDYFDTRTDEIISGGKNKIALWMLDTNYDDRCLYPRQVFFPPSGNKDGWSKLKKTLKSEINEDLIDKFQGTESIPFEAEEHKRIAVKIVDDRGIESFAVESL